MLARFPLCLNFLLFPSDANTLSRLRSSCSCLSAVPYFAVSWSGWVMEGVCLISLSAGLDRVMEGVFLIYGWRLRVSRCSPSPCRTVFSFYVVRLLFGIILILSIFLFLSHFLYCSSFSLRLLSFSLFSALLLLYRCVVPFVVLHALLLVYGFLLLLLLCNNCLFAH